MFWSGSNREFYQHLAALTAIVALAGAMRLLALDTAPPGLYRDEAFNGLDAVGVIAGQHAIFFEGNNGREPLYIYLVALSVRLFGQTAWAVRLPAALAGTLTTVPVYLLTRSWFGRSTALFAAALWAITLWPVHLSRIGFRVILLPLFITSALYLATLAWKRRHSRWGPAAALLAGGVYGASFYTYLAARLTPLFLLLFGVYLWRQARLRRWRRFGVYFSVATLIVLLPLLSYWLAQPQRLAGRSGQVAIIDGYNATEWVGLLARSTLQSLGMFVWRGDMIVRHNPPGRPVFDLLLLAPFLVGIVICLRRRRQPAAAATLLFPAVMLLGTVLAQDAPHFLRAAGVLPFPLIMAAIGLSSLWRSFTLPAALRHGAWLLVVGSTVLTVHDYRDYSHRPETFYLFEGAARALAEAANRSGAHSSIDRRFSENWASVRFLTTAPVTYFDRGSPALAAQGVYYVWPFEAAEFVLDYVRLPAHVQIEIGPPARGDLEAQAAPLYLQLTATPLVGELGAAVANFDNQFWLQSFDVAAKGRSLQLMLQWRGAADQQRQLSAFVHVVDRQSGRIIAQLDRPPGAGHWSVWMDGLLIEERRELTLPVPFDAEQHLVRVGVYDPVTAQRLPVLSASGSPSGDSVALDR